MLNKALNITNKIVLLAVGTALFLGITITILFNYIFIKNQAKEVAQLEFLLKQDYDNQIKNHTDIVISMLDNFEKFGPEFGLTEDQLENFAAKVLRNVKYGEVGYFWADKSDGQNVFIINSSTEGTNRLHIEDANGLLLVDEIIKAALNGGDFTDYWWPKVKGGDPMPKRGYSAYFKPFDWILGTGNYIDDIDMVLDEHKNSSSDSLRKGIILQIIALVIFSIITVLLSIFLGKKLSRPIIKLASKANLIGEGDLNTYFDINSKDEIGNLAETLNKMVVRLRDVVNGIANGLQNISNASQQLSNASEQLSQGANEQASSIEEVSSTMEQITANIQQNTDNATQTEKVSNEANEGIKEVADRSQQAVQANKEIANKITIINDIAFQTNILALNAAVEAARAGEHGKGFAVVAAEVRKLAERSKAAAEEIVGLAQSSLELATGAGEVMISTIPKIENTTQLVGEISAASLEQNNGAGQVNNAIQQLNSITQQNAASSEELATSAEELASQAEQMNDAIAFFDLGEAKYKNGTKKEFIKSGNHVVNKKFEASKTSQGAKIVLSKGDNTDNEFENF